MSGFLAKGCLLRVSDQSRLSANDEGDSRMMPRVVHRSPVLTIKLRKKKCTFIHANMISKSYKSFVGFFSFFFSFLLASFFVI